MTHHRIITSIWFLFGVIGLAFSAIECVRLLFLGESFSSGSLVSTFIGFAFCVLAVATSIGVYRAKSWARISAIVISVLLSLYCISFLSMVGLEFGAIAYAASWLGIAFAAYTCAMR